MTQLEAEESTDLEDTRILVNKWGEPEGAFVYDISYLHEDWGRVTQTYDIYTTNDDGEPVYSSEFLLFRKGEDEASDFSSYPRELIIELWKVVFAIKRKFFEEHKPAEVYHLIKQPHTVAERIPVYRRNLNLPEYTVIRSRQTITYVRNK